MRYLVIIEEATGSFGAYVPDLPGCIAAAESREEVLAVISEAIALHLEDLRRTGQTVPEPSSTCELVDVAA